MLPRVTKFRVAGTVRSGLYEFDSAWAYVPAGRRAAALRPTATAPRLVEVRIDDIYAVREVAAAHPGRGWATATSPPTGSR